MTDREAMLEKEYTPPCDAEPWVWPDNETCPHTECEWWEPCNSQLDEIPIWATDD